MTITEASLQKMSKDNIIILALDYQDKFNSTLVNINKDIGELKYKFEKLESELAVSKSVISNLFKIIITLERQCCANNQYSRRECLEISGIPESIENKDLENLTLQIFEKIDISVDAGNIEDCQQVKTQRSKKVIIKLSRRKDANKIRSEKKKLKGKNLTYIKTKFIIHLMRGWK